MHPNVQRLSLSVERNSGPLEERFFLRRSNKFPVLETLFTTFVAQRLAAFAYGAKSREFESLQTCKGNSSTVER